MTSISYLVQKIIHRLSRIIDHEFSHQREFKSDLQLLILWDDEKEPQWSSWNKSLGEEETVHKYLNDNFMARFIPRKFTWKFTRKIPALSPRTNFSDVKRQNPLIPPLRNEE